MSALMLLMPPLTFGLIKVKDMGTKNSGFILVKAKAKKDRRSLDAFLATHGLESKEIPQEELEDLGLLMAMLSADRNKRVSRDTIMRKLSR